MTSRKKWLDIVIAVWAAALLIAAAIHLSATPALAVDCGLLCDAECVFEGGCGGVLDYGPNSRDCTFVCADSPEDVIFVKGSGRGARG